MSDCQHCGASCDAFLCYPCTDRLVRAVSELPELLSELDITRTRQSRTFRTSSARVRLDEDADEHSELSLRASALPVNLDASELAWVAGDTVGAWVGHICVGLRMSPPRPREVLSWLVSHVRWMRGDPQGGQCLDEFGYLTRSIVRMIDRSPERFYAGPCTGAYPAACRLDLYARAGASGVTCDGYRSAEAGCGARYTTDERRDWLVAEVESALLPLPVMRGALEWLTPSVPLPAGPTWRSWRNRGRLVPHGLDRAGNELFRGSEVLALVRDEGSRTGPRRASSRA